MVYFNNPLLHEDLLKEMKGKELTFMFNDYYIKRLLTHTRAEPIVCEIK